VNPRFATAIALAALLAAAFVVSAADDAARVLVYRTESWDLRAATADDVKATAVVVAKRCAHAGFEGVAADVSKDGKSIEVRLPKALADSEAAVRHLVERRGDVSFRVRASQKMEDEHRDKRLYEGAPAPEGYAWVPDEHSTLLALVETPEAPFEAKLAAFVAADPKPEPAESAKWREVKDGLAKVWAESVFTNAEIASSSVRRSLSTYGAQSLMHVNVRFEFADARKAAFEKFTGANVGRQLCVVVEGKVHVSPVINAAIPGAGELRAPGTGYTEPEAQEMSAILESGPLAVRLVPTKDN